MQHKHGQACLIALIKRYTVEQQQPKILEVTTKVTNVDTLAYTPICDTCQKPVEGNVIEFQYRNRFSLALVGGVETVCGPCVKQQIIDELKTRNTENETMRIIKPKFDLSAHCRRCGGNGRDSLGLVCCNVHKVTWCRQCRGTGYALLPVPDKDTRYTNSYVTFTRWHDALKTAMQEHGSLFSHTAFHETYVDTLL